MECNRDEAVRAKEIAESKFKAKDTAGAKKFALKAHTLFPGLEGISQMLTTFEVYHAAENKVSGETNWYAVLDVNAMADDETVKKQYRKLALLLHPDKNKSIGAEGAFKLVSEAWNVLSDKARRMAHDKKMNVRVQNQKVSQQSRHSSTPNANWLHNFSKTAVSNMRPPQPATNLAPSSVSATSHRPRLDTFWTSCDHCKMQYEYSRLHLNRKLVCPCCKKAFLAVDKGIPANVFNSRPFSFRQNWQQNVNENQAKKNAHVPGRDALGVPDLGTAGFAHGMAVDSFNQINLPQGPHFRIGGVASTTTLSPAPMQTANVVHHAHEKVQGRHEDIPWRKNYTSKGVHIGPFANISNAASSANIIDQKCPTQRLERLAKKQKCLDDDGGCNSAGNRMKQAATGNERTSTGFRATSSKKETVSELSRILLEGRAMLIEMGRKLIREKLKEWKEEEKEKVAVTESDQSKLDASISEKEKISNVSPGIHGAEPGKEIPKPVSIDVPDPDFHDFDKDKTEKSFLRNQVWAAYDDDDGMPRFYALIQKVVSLHPFKMYFSWLNSKTNTELGPLNWVSSGFSKSCGEFRVGRFEVINTVNIFSHQVRWERGIRGVIRIFPSKGDIWALYRNWSPDWNENTPEALIHVYDMVEVLENYSEDQGVVVIPLVKVVGFKTVFSRHTDPTRVKRIPREEMFRFSHQVPLWLLTGEEAENAPRGCLELDPASTPVDLLEVMTQINDVVIDTAKQLVTTVV